MKGATAGSRATSTDRSESTCSASRHTIGVLVLNTKQFIGSVQHIHATLARLLDKGRFKVFIATPPDCDDQAVWEGAEGVTVWTVPLGGSIPDRSGFAVRVAAVLANLQLLHGLLRLAVRIRRERIEIIHTATSPRDMLGGLVLSLLTGAALVIHWHHIFWGWYPLIWRLGFRRARAILAVSEASRRSLVAVGVPAEKLHVLYNGIALDHFPPQLDPRPLRRELGIAPEAAVVLLPGRLCPGKGQADLLRAVALLKERGRDVTALVVGRDDPSATPGGGSHRAELERLRRELGIEDCVLLVDHRSDMPAVMAAADVVAVPTHGEPFGTVVLEAMASGRPVVGTLSGGTPEQIEDGTTGLLVPVGAPEALARALERLLADPELRRKLGENGRRQAEERFSQERMAQDAERFYEALLGERP